MDHDSFQRKDQRQASGAGCAGVDAMVWVFGYGSLLWKTNFTYQEKVVGYVEGYARRFWQGSTDHRGFPGAPGRVVTLVQMQQECTWGIAYKVHAEDVPEVMAYLDHREKGGYSTHQVTFHPKEPTLSPFTVLAYIATELNFNYLGPASTEDIARTVIESRGPSGCNIQYAWELMQAMREIAPSVEDQHLTNLEAKIREILQENDFECNHLPTNDVYDCVCRDYIVKFKGSI